MPRIHASVVLIALAGLSDAPADAPPAAPVEGDLVFYQDVAWSSDGERLACSAMRIPRTAWERERYAALEKTQFDIHVIELADRSRIQITHDPGNDLWGVWWPGGRCLLYAAEREGSSGLCFMEADGSDRQSPKGLPEHATQPAVSPDGRLIAFMSRQDGESHIYVTGSDLPAPRKVTSTGPNNWNPVWSPDGSRILFYTDREGDGRDQVCVVNADGSAETQLTHDAYNNIFPAWSPDGKRILFASNRDGKGREGIYVMNADGSDVRRLVPGMRAAFARWSPDGRRLAFISGEFPDTRIYLAGADGSNPQPLTR